MYNFRKHLLEFLIGALCFLVLMLGIPQYLIWKRMYTDPRNWFEVNQIYVSDFVVGDTPKFFYDRNIKQKFSGEYDVEIQWVGQNGALYRVCGGRGEREYSPEKTLPPDYDLDWFVNAKCILLPGTYRVEATWHINVPNYPPMVYTKTSNVFNVISKKMVVDKQ